MGMSGTSGRSVRGHQQSKPAADVDERGLSFWESPVGKLVLVSALLVVIYMGPFLGLLLYILGPAALLGLTAWAVFRMVRAQHGGTRSHRRRALPRAHPCDSCASRSGKVALPVAWAQAVPFSLLAFRGYCGPAWA